MTEPCGVVELRPRVLYEGVNAVVFGWLRKRTSRLMFWAVAARKNCSLTNFNLRRRSLCRPMRPLSSANNASTFFRCRCACSYSGVFQRSRARCRAASFMWIARKRNAPLVHCDFRGHGPHLGRVPMGKRAVSVIASAVIQLLTCGTEIAVAFRLVCEALRAEQRTPCPSHSIACGHIRIRRSINHCNNSPLP